MWIQAKQTRVIKFKGQEFVFKSHMRHEVTNDLCGSAIFKKYVAEGDFLILADTPIIGKAPASVKVETNDKAVDHKSKKRRR